MFTEYRTVTFMRSLTFSDRRCCSVSLLVSTSFAAAKLHHIAGRSLHRPPASTAGLVSKYVPLVLTLAFLSLLSLLPLLSATLGPTSTGTTDDEQFVGGFFVEFTDDDLVA